MELLLINPDIEEPTDVEESTSTIEGKVVTRFTCRSSRSDENTLFYLENEKISVV